MRAGDVTSHCGQALEGVALVIEQAGGGDRYAMIAIPPFAQQDRARREVELTRLGAQFDLGVLGADGFQPLTGFGRKTAEGFLLQLVGDAGLDVGTIRIVGAARKVPIPERPKFGHGHLAQVGNLPRHGLLLGERVVHHNVSC